MTQTKARKPAADLGPDAAFGAALERERTLAILDCFLGASIPEHDKYLVGRIRERVTSRRVADVLTDPKPVIQLPPADTGPKGGAR